MDFQLSDFINVIYLVYSAIRGLIETLFKETISKGSPELAAKFADATTLIITITAIWLILEFTTGLRRVVRFIVIFGWVLLLLSIIVSLSKI